MPEWETHREIFEPPRMTSEMIDRIYFVMVFGMGLAFVCGVGAMWAFERMFHYC